MTAFDNIKVNNWPATSNDFEDFLVLKVPLNDQASLTESLPVAAGSKELFPKRTLTNSGVLSAETGLVYSANSSGGAFYSTGSWAQAFDGSLTTGPFTYSSTSNTLTLPPGVTWSNKIRVYALRYGGVFEINGTSVISGMNSTPSWHNLTTTLGSSGTLTTIEIGDVGTNYVKLFAVELDDTILVNPLGGSKKHYDNNAYFNGSSALTLQNSGIKLGGDYCIEGYFRADIATGGYTRVLDFTPANIRFIIVDTNNTIYLQLGAGGSITTASNSWSSGTWHHFAVTRQGATNRLFIDGVEKGTVSTSASFDLSTEMTFNGTGAGSYRWTGAMQDLRIYNGTAKYTSNFTPPAAILG